jgi:hypothetical protein
MLPVGIEDCPMKSGPQSRQPAGVALHPAADHQQAQTQAAKNRRCWALEDNGEDR